MIDIGLKRILIIEDEPTIAFDLQDLLEDAGFRIAGVAPTIATAIALIRNTPMDAAIVDANLAGLSSGPAAAALDERKIPFLVLSGYSSRQRQDVFPTAHFLQKPCRPDDLIAALTELCRR